MTPMGLNEIFARVHENDLEREKNRLVETVRAQQALVAKRRVAGGTVGLSNLMDNGPVEAVDDKPLEVPKKEMPVNGRFPLPPGAKR